MSTTEAVAYASAPARDSLATRARRRPLALAAAGLFVALIVLLVWSSRPADYTPLSPGNTTGEGARAAAEILRDQGVTVDHAATLGAIRIPEPSSTTLVVATPYSLQDYQIDALLDYPGDLVLLGTDDRTLAGTGMTASGADLAQAAPALCDADDAAAAGAIEVGPEGAWGTPAPGVTACFVTGDGLVGYVDSSREAGRLTVLASPDIVTNARLAEEGNAALTLRTLGRHANLVWYVADPFDSSVPAWDSGDGVVPPESVPVSPDFLPPGVLPAAFALGLTVIVAALWRARRFGPLVSEPLPVVVRASEATRGRTRLYRRGRATGRATAALRAHAALRMGRRLGIPRAADADALVDAIHRATGRERADIHRILYGPSPTTDAAMATLITALDTLESEVYRP